MRKNYEEITLDILLVTEDVVRCSDNTYSVGDDIGADIFD